MDKWKIVMLITFTLAGAINLYRQEYMLGVMWFWLLMMHAFLIQAEESVGAWRGLFYEYRALYERLVEAAERKVRENETTIPPNRCRCPQGVWPNSIRGPHEEGLR